MKCRNSQSGSERTAAPLGQTLSSRQPDVLSERTPFSGDTRDYREDQAGQGPASGDARPRTLGGRHRVKREADPRVVKG